jgi:hypothetical protein
MGMNAKELRIGNFVFNNNKVIEIENIYDDAVNVLFFAGGWGDYGYVSDDNKISNLNPIPITEEWLLKFGFNNVSDNFSKSFQKNGFRVSLGSDNAWYREEYLFNEGIEEKDWMGAEGIDIETIHQLQNLYFALTGEELSLTNL